MEKARRRSIHGYFFSIQSDHYEASLLPLHTPAGIQSCFSKKFKKHNVIDVRGKGFLSSDPSSKCAVFTVITNLCWRLESQSIRTLFTVKDETFSHFVCDASSSGGGWRSPLANGIPSLRGGSHQWWL